VAGRARRERLPHVFVDNRPSTPPERQQHGHSQSKEV
jgi:hypothetical protein